MTNDTYLYPYSSAEARDRNELPLWRESHKANIACRNAIEDAIRCLLYTSFAKRNCPPKGSKAIHEIINAIIENIRKKWAFFRTRFLVCVCSLISHTSKQPH